MPRGFNHFTASYLDENPDCELQKLLDEMSAAKYEDYEKICVKLRKRQAEGAKGTAKDTEKDKTGITG